MIVEVMFEKKKYNIKDNHHEKGFVAHTCRSFSPGYDISAVKDMRTIMSSTNFP